MSRQVVSIDPIRTLAFGSITASYVKVGGIFAHGVRLFTLVNDTDGGMFWSDDGVNDKLYTPAGTFKLLDLCTNRYDIDPIWCLPIGTQIWVRYNTAPTMKSVYVECLWGE